MSKKSNKPGDHQLLEFHFLLATTLTSGAATILMNAGLLGSFSSRIGTEADFWAHFRFKQLRFRLRVTPSTVAAQFAGFVGGVQDTPPGTAQAVMELLPSCMMDLDQTVPSEWITVSRSELAGPLPWYKTIQGTADSTEEAPGQLVVVGTGSEAFGVELRGVIEFKTAVSTANTPMAIRLRALARAERLEAERERESRAIRAILAPHAPVSAALSTSSLTK